jgi:hypothetical protein
MSLSYEFCEPPLTRVLSKFRWKVNRNAIKHNLIPSTSYRCMQICLIDKSSFVQPEDGQCLWPKRVVVIFIQQIA